MDVSMTEKCNSHKGMLKSCIGPCDLIAGRHLISVRSFASQHAFISIQPRHHLRQKSSKSSRSQRGKQRAARSANTLPASASEIEIVKHGSGQSPNVQKEHEIPTSQKSAPTDPGQSSTHRTINLDRINPAPSQDLSSTRPAIIESPTPLEPGADGKIAVQDRAKWLYALGKSYLTFYKKGLSNIWTNRKEYKKIKERLGSFSPDEAALYGGQILSKNDPRRVPHITRREYQLCRRTRHDLRKLIPFATVFAICGEFTPLVIVALGSRVAPYTCRIPKQVAHDRKWFVKRLEAKTAEKLSQYDPNRLKGWRYDLEFAFLQNISPVANLPPILGQLYYNLWVQPRMMRRGWEILCDTVLIHREGGFGALEPIEINEYANRFFCPAFVFRNQKQIKASGELAWSDKTANLIIPALEKHASTMLGHDWGQIPEEHRYQYGLLCDGDGLSQFLQDLKHPERTKSLL